MIEYTGQTRADYTFFLPISLRVTDVDINDHVNQSVYYEFFDTAVLRYLEQFKIVTEATQGTGSVCVENGCRYRREVKFSDAVEVGLRVAKLGTTSIRFELAVFTAANDDPNTLAYFVLVFIDKTTRRPAPMPAELR